MEPLISFIIPCYNSGKYLNECVLSVEHVSINYKCELIIVDDGSTDEHTLILIKELQKKYTIIRQENKGPAAARNTGIKLSRGEYIFFLDSDNKVRLDYLKYGINILSNNDDIGVVYAKPFFFGDTTIPRFNTHSFNFLALLSENFIDMCSLIRRKVWEDVDGLDEAKQLIGFEDWEFWIRVSLKGWKFHFLDQELFDYRINDGSLIMQANERFDIASQYIHCKHITIFHEIFQNLLFENKIYIQDQDQPFRSFLKYFANKYFKKG